MKTEKLNLKAMLEQQQDVLMQEQKELAAALIKQVDQAEEEMHALAQRHGQKMREMILNRFGLTETALSSLPGADDEKVDAVVVTPESMAATDGAGYE